MRYTDYLTREERIQRIGQLLSKGITLMLLREAEENRVAEQQTPTGAVDQPALDSLSPSAGDKVDRLDDDERKILAYIQRVRAASPRDMQRYFIRSRQYRPRLLLIQPAGFLRISCKPTSLNPTVNRLGLSSSPVSGAISLFLTLIFIRAIRFPTSCRVSFFH
jgi:hypothetical protein